GDPPAHRMPDEMRLPETQGGDHVPAVEREVEHVLEQVLSRRLAVARQLGSEHVIAARELIEEGVLIEETAGAMQEDQRRSTAALDHAAPGPAARLDAPGLHRGFSAPGRVSSGRSRSSIGWIHQRSSCFHSGQRSRRCGITFSAKSLEECRVFQSGMLPLWKRQKRWPTRKPLIPSSSCCRTVSGLPAMMKRSSTSCLQVSCSKIL